MAQLALGDRYEVVEGGADRTGRVPWPVVVLGEEVLDGTHLQAVGSTDRGLETVQRNRRWSGLPARPGLSPVARFENGVLVEREEATAA